MAADVSARVHLVAEKLAQKSADAQRKGNENAARALATSVADLREAMALLAEQRHLLARRRGEGHEEEDDADAHVQELATRLARVEAMLGKKSEDMKLKGNKGAAASLQQSAGDVDKGRALLLEQQQTIFGLLGRWEKLEDVVEGKKRRRTSDGEEEKEENEKETPHGRLIGQVQSLVELKGVLAEVFPGCEDAEEVKDEVERLRREVENAKEETIEVNEMLKQESLALEEAKKELERVKHREIQRQEEDAALLEQQREACQAMEELVRESDQEIQKMTQEAAARAEELQSLRVEMESLALEKERLVRAHADEVNELQAQLASAMDALSTKADESAEVEAEEFQALQAKLDVSISEKEELIKLHVDEIEELRQQLESVSASLSAKSEDNAAPNVDELESLQTQVEKLTSEKEDLIRSHASELEELHNAHIIELEELREQLESATVSLPATPGNAVFDADAMELLQSQVDSLTKEKVDLIKTHSDEVEELNESHATEIEELRQQLQSAEVSLTGKSEDDAALNADEVESLQAQVDNLTSEKEGLVRTHLDEVEELRQAYAIEIEELRQQLESATVSLAAKAENNAENAAFDADELESLQNQLDTLTSEKEELAQAHADEVEELQKSHAVEMEELQQQLENAEASDALESLQNQLDTLASEKEELVRTHLDEVEELQKSHAVEMEELRQQLESATASLAAKSESIAASDADELESLQSQVDNLVSEQENLIKSHADEVDELRQAHANEIQELRQQLEGATECLAAKDEDNAAFDADELESLQNHVDGLTSEKESLIKSHADEIGMLQKSHRVEIEAIRQQLDDAINALESKTEEMASLDAEEVQCLQAKVNGLMMEKEDILKSHAGETEELRRQLADVTNSLASQAERSAATDADELQSLKEEILTLVTEKKSLAEIHASELDNLRVMHQDEIEELCEQLDNATAALSANREEQVVSNADELQQLRAEVGALTIEKDHLVKEQADKIEKLKHQAEDAASDEESVSDDEVEEEDRDENEAVGDVPVLQLDEDESQSAAFAAEDEVEASSNGGDVGGDEKKTAELQVALDGLQAQLAGYDERSQVQQDTISTLEREQEELQRQIELLANEKTQADEAAAELQRAHDAEVLAMQTDLDSIQTQVTEYEERHQALQNTILTLEREQEKLQEQIELLTNEKTQADEAAVELQRAHEAEVLTLQTDLDTLQAQVTEYEERHQALQNTISTLGREQEELQEQNELLTNEKTQATEAAAGLQRAHDAEVLTLQTNLDTLQAQITEYEDRLQELQNTISTLETEQTELQERIDQLRSEKDEAVGALQNTHGEETTRLAQRVADSEGVIESLSSQLSETKNALSAKLAELNETAGALERCEAELRTCRSELDAQIEECSQVKNDLEAVQDAESTKSEEANKRLSQLVAELGELATCLDSTDKVDAEAAGAFTGKAWESPEVTEICSRIASLLTKLVSTQDQLHTTEEQRESLRKKCGTLKLLLDQFVKQADWRLFAKEGEDEEEVLGSLKSVKIVSERLNTAKTNATRWLDELQQLRDRIQADTNKLNGLEEEKLREQGRLLALEESKRGLDSMVESLNEQLAVVRSEKEDMMNTAEKLKAENHSASVQEQQQQAAQQEEVAELQQQLTTVRSDFERYRVRSHTALKKMEKRAELLNGMRKENEVLLKQVQESDQQREHAEAARQESEARLQEVLRTQEMMQADFDQLVAEKARVIAELEEEGERLVSEREQTDKQIQELTLKIQELEKEKTQIEEESERIKEAEQEAFQARLSTATAAVQTAKQDLQMVHDALEASKAENDKRQKRIESLELELEQQRASVASTTVANSSSPGILSLTASAPPLSSSSADVNRNVAGLEKELSTLRASEASLRKQLDDARAELIALQERFATTKAANAEKVFALEEQSNHWKIELAAATEVVRRLNAMLEEQKLSANQSALSNGAPSGPSPVNQQSQEKHSGDKVRELKTELADANTEITLLTRALDACREELQSARDQIDLLTPASSEPESGEDPSGAAKASVVLAAKDEVLKKLRVQVLELQEEMQTLRDEKAALELELEKEELDELQASRKNLQSEKERAMQLQRRQTLVSGIEKQVTTLVNELQQRLEDHSSAFREVCDFRDEHRAALFANGGGVDDAAGRAGEPEFQECLVMRSGVVIKAGASFQLPVICEKRGWRVVWSFSVKEDSADVSFKLAATVADATSTQVEVVSPERMNEMSGVFQVQHDNTTLVFEWDNSFSWLNEKTLDYHVSIQEPLTPQAQKVRRSERDLQTKAKLLEDGLELIQAEAQRRSELSATLERLSECESAKNKHLEEFGARKTEVLEQKTSFQEEMEAQKAAFSAMLREQDELEDVERSIMRAWEAAVAEREDVEMTLQLAGNGAQLETLAQEMKEQAESVAEQLKNPIRLEKEESSPSEEQQVEKDDNELMDGHAEGEASAQQEDEESTAME